MLLGVLEFTDFAIIAALIVFLAGGSAAASSYLKPVERKRLRRIEEKLDMLLAHNNLQYSEPKLSSWQEMSDNPARKIAAIKAYREEHGVGLAEAKEAVDEYIRIGEQSGK